MDKLEEAENLRVTEAKETEYKPVVMGKYLSTALLSAAQLVPPLYTLVWVSLGCGCHPYKSQPDHT